MTTTVEVPRGMQAVLVRSTDLQRARRLLNKQGDTAGDVRDALRTLIGFMETGARWNTFECSTYRLAAWQYGAGVVLGWHTGHLLIQGTPAEIERIAGEMVAAANAPAEVPA